MGASASFLLHRAENEWDPHMYGRIDIVHLQPGMPRHTPQMLSCRPWRTVPFTLPFSFVMAPAQVGKIRECKSLEEVLSEIICLESIDVASRIDLVKDNRIDHVLMTFSSHDIPIKPATIEGIGELLNEGYPEVGQRFARVKFLFEMLSGANRFQDRLDACAELWDDWFDMSQHMWRGNHCERCEQQFATGANHNNREEACICGHYSFDEYCSEFDMLVESNDVVLPLVSSKVNDKANVERQSSGGMVSRIAKQFSIPLGTTDVPEKPKAVVLPESIKTPPESVISADENIDKNTKSSADPAAQGIVPVSMSEAQRKLYLITRKMLYVILGCNKYYGHDGMTYDAAGIAIGEEYLTVNRGIDDGLIHCLFLSDVEHLRV